MLNLTLEEVKQSLYSSLDSDSLSTNEKKVLAPFIAGAEAVATLVSPIFEALWSVASAGKQLVGRVVGWEDHSFKGCARNLLNVGLMIPAFFIQIPIVALVFCYQTIQIIIDPEVTRQHA